MGMAAKIRILILLIDIISNLYANFDMQIIIFW